MRTNRERLLSQLNQLKQNKKEIAGKIREAEKKLYGMQERNEKMDITKELLGKKVIYCESFYNKKKQKWEKKEAVEARFLQFGTTGADTEYYGGSYTTAILLMDDGHLENADLSDVQFILN